MAKSLTIFFLPLMFLILLTTAQAFSYNEPNPKQTTETQRKKLAARDAITISIREIQETRKFVNSIPRLKVVQLTQQTPQLLNCVEGLISDLSNINPTLYRLRHLKPFHLMSDAERLKPKMDHIVKRGKKCSKSLKRHVVDGVVLSMLNRKLDDLSLIVENVVYHVSVIEREVYGAEADQESP